MPAAGLAQVRSFLTDQKISAVLESKNHETVPLGGHLVALTVCATVETAFALMQRENIIALPLFVPVVNEHGKTERQYVALINALDFLTFTAFQPIFNDQTHKVDIHISEQQLEEPSTTAAAWWQSRVGFLSHPVTALIGLTRESEKLIYLKPETSLLDALRVFARLRCHRVMVGQPNAFLAAAQAKDGLTLLQKQIHQDPAMDISIPVLTSSSDSVTDQELRGKIHHLTSEYCQKCKLKEPKENTTNDKNLQSLLERDKHRRPRSYWLPTASKQNHEIPPRNASPFMPPEPISPPSPTSQPTHFPSRPVESPTQEKQPPIDLSQSEVSLLAALQLDDELSAPECGDPDILSQTDLLRYIYNNPESFEMVLDASVSSLVAHRHAFYREALLNCQRQQHETHSHELQNAEHGSRRQWHRSLHQHHLSLGSLADLEGSCSSVTQAPVYLQHHLSALAGFQKMYVARVHAVAIVDEQGRLVGNLSASDLRGLGRDNIHQVLLPVLVYLKRRREDILKEQEQTILGQVWTCRKSFTVSQVIGKMLKLGVHRLWLVENNSNHSEAETTDQPTAMITMADVLHYAACLVTESAE